MVQPATRGKRPPRSAGGQPARWIATRHQAPHIPLVRAARRRDRVATGRERNVMSKDAFRLHLAHRLKRIRLAIDHGAAEYIMKPFDGDIIASKFEAVGLI